MKNSIFYFSGTGNSLQVAKDIAERLGECEVLNLAQYDTANTITAERVGIVFPVYFWGLPNIVKKFLEKLEFENNPYLFAVATCGNVIGASLQQINDLLKLRNRTLDSGFRLQMPENYIVYYNADSKAKQQLLFHLEKSIVENISKVVMNKKKQPIEKSKYGVDTLLGKVVNRIALKNFAMKDMQFVIKEDSCTGCGKCAKVCSIGNITMKDEEPTWNHHCEFCLGCLQNCPAEAINYKKVTQKRIRYRNPNITTIERMNF